MEGDCDSLFDFSWKWPRGREKPCNYKQPTNIMFHPAAMADSEVIRGQAVLSLMKGYLLTNSRFGGQKWLDDFGA